MKILIDTNILIDYISKREGYFNNANHIISLCANDKIDGCIAAHSVMNAIYITRKEYTIAERKKILSGLCKILTLVGIDKEKILSALENDAFSDVEDCLQTECAKEFSADYIITRNIKDFQYSTVPAVLPDDFLHIINSDNNS